MRMRKWFGVFLNSGVEEEQGEQGLSVLEGVLTCWGTEHAGKDQSCADSPWRAEPMEALSLSLWKAVVHRIVCRLWWECGKYRSCAGQS